MEKYRNTAKLLLKAIWNETVNEKREKGNPSEQLFQNTELRDSLHGNLLNNSLVLPNYVSHLIEIADFHRIQNDLRDIWNPMKKLFDAQEKEKFNQYLAEFIRKKERG